MKRRGMALGDVEIVQQDEFDLDFVITLSPGRGKSGFRHYLRRRLDGGCAARREPMRRCPAGVVLAEILARETREIGAGIHALNRLAFRVLPAGYTAGGP